MTCYVRCPYRMDARTEGNSVVYVRATCTNCKSADAASISRSIYLISINFFNFLFIFIYLFHFMFEPRAPTANQPAQLALRLFWPYLKCSLIVFFSIESVSNWFLENYNNLFFDPATWHAWHMAWHMHKATT